VQWCAGRKPGRRFGDSEQIPSKRQRAADAPSSAAAPSFPPDSVDVPMQNAASAAAATPSFLQRLAVVEVQLILQFLDCGSKMRAARCSSHLLACISHPFPWQFDPVSVGTAQIDEDDSEEESSQDPLLYLDVDAALAHSHSLLRFLPATLIPDSMEWGRALQLLTALPLLLSVCCRPNASCNPQDWINFLTNPAAQQLTELHLGQTFVSDGVVAQLASLPHLVTLQVHVPLFDYSTPELLAPLSQLPALTDLRCSSGHALVEDARCVALRSRMHQSVSSCSNLRHLTLAHQLWMPGELLALFSSPRLQSSLESLCVYNLTKESYGASGSMGDYDTVLQRMERLRTLRFKGVAAIDRLLPHLACLPALQLLEIEPVERFNPRAPLVSELLAATAARSPALCVQFDLRRLSSASSDLHIKCLVWRRALLNCTPGRVLIKTDDA